jgi:hypothetical protein
MEQSMKRNVGVWIDHRKAVIVRIIDGVEDVRSIDSDMEKHVRHSGGSPEDQQDHRFTNHLNEYYAKIMALLHDADAILILGPGEAKGEFEKRINADPLGSRVVGIEGTDKMSDPQIAARVREHFLNSSEEFHHRVTQ